MANFLFDALAPHVGHTMEIGVYGDAGHPANVSLEDMDTHAIVLDAELYSLRPIKKDAKAVSLWERLLEFRDHKATVEQYGDVCMVISQKTGEIIVDSDFYDLAGIR